MTSAMVIKKYHANLSECGNYRYTLSRPPRGEYDAPAIIVGGLNPSTANSMIDDATVRKLMGFCDRWQRGGFVIWNLYAYRSTNPAALWTVPDPVGPLNDVWLHNLLQKGGVTDFLCAWGSGARPDRVKQVVHTLGAYGVRMVCLGVTADGSPRHPLYVRYEQPLIPWQPNY